MLKHRIVTALLLIPLVLFTIVSSNSIYFCALIALTTILAAREWARLLKLNTVGFTIYALFNAVIVLGFYFYDQSVIYIYLAIIAAIFWCFAFVVIVAYQRGVKLMPKTTWLLLIIGQLLLVSMWGSLYFIKVNLAEGTVLILFLIFIIWGADSGAYFVGRSFGKRRMASNVSPGKTWEGTTGGFVFAIVIGVVFIKFTSIGEEDFKMIIFTTLAVVLFSIIGDLFESIMKREANIKDSGQLLPGHGGMLDRIDSLMAASPICLLAYIYIGMTG